MEHITTLERLYELRDGIIKFKDGSSANDPRLPEMQRLIRQTDSIIQLARL